MLKNEEEIESNTQINSNPILWNASKVLNWLKNTLKLEISSNIYKSFEKNEITGQNLLSLEIEDLKELGVNSIHLRSLFHWGINGLKIRTDFSVIHITRKRGKEREKMKVRAIDLDSPECTFGKLIEVCESRWEGEDAKDVIGAKYVLKDKEGNIYLPSSPIRPLFYIPERAPIVTLYYSEIGIEELPSASCLMMRRCELGEEGLGENKLREFVSFRPSPSSPNGIDEECRIKVHKDMDEYKSKYKENDSLNLSQIPTVIMKTGDTGLSNIVSQIGKRKRGEEILQNEFGTSLSPQLHLTIQTLKNQIHTSTIPRKPKQRVNSPTKEGNNHIYNLYPNITKGKTTRNSAMKDKGGEGLNHSYRENTHTVPSYLYFQNYLS